MKYIAIIGIAALVLLAWFLHNAPMVATQPNPSLSTKTISIGATRIVVEVADTAGSREQGLSGRDALLPGSGMLFVFDKVGEYGFWMKDMRFSLDMLFADASGRIVTIDANLSPQTYLQTPPQVFYPAKPALYVLEVPAGFAAAHEVAVGDKLVVQ